MSRTVRLDAARGGARPVADVARDRRARRGRRGRRRPGGRGARARRATATSRSSRARAAPPTDWYFAAGTTVKGAQQYLVLFNPFGDDAIVDVSFLTDAGVQEPDDLQALVVPRRSRVTIPVQDAVPRQRGRRARPRPRRPGRRRAHAALRRHRVRRRGRCARASRCRSAPQSPRRDVVASRRHHRRRRHRRDRARQLRSDVRRTVEVNVVPRRRRDRSRRSRSTSRRAASSTVDVATRVPGRHAVRGDRRPRATPRATRRPSSPSSSRRGRRRRRARGVASTLGSTRLAQRWVDRAARRPTLDGVVTVVNPGTAAGDRGALVVRRRRHAPARPSEPELRDRRRPLRRRSTWSTSVPAAITCSWSRATSRSWSVLTLIGDAGGAAISAAIPDLARRG